METKAELPRQSLATAIMQPFSVPITLSFGTRELEIDEGSENSEALIGGVDKAMCRAKRPGAAAS